MRILGLDVSTVATGFCIFDSLTECNKPLAYGVINPDTELTESEKYYYIAEQIKLLIKIYRPDDISVEDTFYSKDPTVLKKLSRIAGQVQYIWYDLMQKNVNFYMAMTARKSIGLKGTAKKEEIVEAVNKFFDMRGRIKDHNIADAFVVGYHHLVAKNNPIKEVEHTIIKSETKVIQVDTMPEQKRRKKIKP